MGFKRRLRSHRRAARACAVSYRSRIGKTNSICAPAAALQLTGVLRGVVGFFRFDLTEVGNRGAAFRKMRHDFERATHGLNEAPQIADVHICPVFHLGDGGLMHLEPRCQLRLRLLAREMLMDVRRLRQWLEIAAALERSAPPGIRQWCDRRRRAGPPWSPRVGPHSPPRQRPRPPCFPLRGQPWTKNTSR